MEALQARLSEVEELNARLQQQTQGPSAASMFPSVARYNPSLRDLPHSAGLFPQGAQGESTLNPSPELLQSFQP